MKNIFDESSLKIKVYNKMKNNDIIGDKINNINLDKTLSSDNLEKMDNIIYRFLDEKVDSYNNSSKLIVYWGNNLESIVYSKTKRDEKAVYKILDKNDLFNSKISELRDLIYVDNAGISERVAKELILIILTSLNNKYNEILY